MMKKMTSDWNRSAGVRDKAKRTTVQGRKKKAAARASATHISYNREGARLWRDRFNQETREKTARQEREEKRQRL
jgi:hypothetical protein